MDYRTEAPEIVQKFLTYHETIRGHSRQTVEEYYLDLRMFLRYIKIRRGLVAEDTEFNQIPIDDVDLALISSVTITDFYDFLSFLARDREKKSRSGKSSHGISAKSRARKVATIRSFYKYLTVKAHLLEENPIQELDSPVVPKTLPKFLTLEESISLLNSVSSGPNRERDFCILTLFLNCGLRISELVGLDLSDIRADHIRILGKGNKERIVFLNDATADAINSYLAIRKNLTCSDKNALFVSREHRRISRAGVHALVKKYLCAAGLDSTQYSAHKLRHTAATLMLRNGVDVKTLQELLGHEHLNTTQIYTHVDNTDLKIAASANPLAKFQKND